MSYEVHTTKSEAIDDWRELASRENHGLTISLLWSKQADVVKVTVVDWRIDEKLDVPVASTDALEAFYHPFAYMARRDSWVGDRVRESLDLQPQS